MFELQTVDDYQAAIEEVMRLEVEILLEWKEKKISLFEQQKISQELKCIRNELNIKMNMLLAKK